MKKKLVALFICFSMALPLSACGISQEDFDKSVSDKEAAQTELATTKDSLDQIQADYDKLKEDYDKLKSDSDQYKEKMKPFEKMTAAQAEAETLKAEQEKAAIEEEKARKAAEEEAAAAKKAEEEAAAKAAEEALGYETGITYEQLARTPDDFKGKKVKFHGKVIQVIEGTSTVQIRLAVNDDYDTILFGEYDSSIVSSRILEDDEITIYGVSVGTISYQSTMGGTITIPGIDIEKIDL